MCSFNVVDLLVHFQRHRANLIAYESSQDELSVIVTVTGGLSSVTSTHRIVQVPCMSHTICSFGDVCFIDWTYIRKSFRPGLLSLFS